MKINAFFKKQVTLLWTLKTYTIKSFKIIITLFISALFINCSNDVEEPTIILSKTNIAGSYTITNLTTDAKVTSLTDVGGVLVPLDVATSTSNWDTFQIDFKLEEEGTFKAEGLFRTISTVTPVVGNPVSETSILDIDASGNFTLDTTNNTINFSSSVGEFLSGTFDIVTFNETSLVLYQEAEETEDSITTEMKTSISFERN